jgi:hypothetical protein
MNAQELEKLLMEWGVARRALEELEQQIKDEVLMRGKTFSTHAVTASYSGGRRRFDWLESGKQAPIEIMVRHTTQPPRPPVPDPVTDWKAVCKEAGIEPTFTKSAPSVKIKVVKPKDTDVKVRMI